MDNIALVDLIVVNPPYRKQGHALRIYREFFKKCIDKRCYTVIALMKKADSYSQDFHKALAFHEGTLNDESGYDEKQLVAMNMDLPVPPNESLLYQVHHLLLPKKSSLGDERAGHVSNRDPPSH